MALPTTPPLHFGRFGWNAPPFISAAGNVYAFGRDVTDEDELVMFKTTDPTDDAEWGEVDAAGRPLTGATNIWGSAYAHQVGDIIHIVASWPDTSGMDTLETYEYHQFNMATDSWDLVGEFIAAGESKADGRGCTLNVRSDGTIVVAFVGDAAALMGNDFARSYYIIRSAGGTWGTEVPLDISDEDERSWRIQSSVLNPSDDRIHFFLGLFEDAAPDLWSRVHQSLSGADVLDTTDEYETGVATLGRAAHGIGVAYDDGDTIKVRVSNALVADGVVEFDSAANPTITQVSAQDVRINQVLGGGLSSGTGPASSSMAVIGTDQYLVFLPFGASDDLSYAVNTGSGWGSDIFIDSPPGTTFVCCGTIYVRDGNFRLAVLWGDNDGPEYQEVDLGPAPVAAGIPDLHMAQMQPAA